MQHKIILEWQNYTTQNCEYVLMTDVLGETFYLMRLSSEGNGIEQYECTDHISICEIAADRMDEYSYINYLDDDYYHVFKKFLDEEYDSNQGNLAEVKKQWAIFEEKIDEYAEEHSIAGTPEQEDDYQNIIRNWNIYYNLDFGYPHVYFGEYDGNVHAVTVVVDEQAQNYSGRSWKEVYKKYFADDVEKYLKSDSAQDGTIFSKRQLDLLSKEKR